MVGTENNTISICSSHGMVVKVVMGMYFQMAHSKPGGPRTLLFIILLSGGDAPLKNT